MKTFIFFLILIIGFFFYLFSTDNSNSDTNQTLSNTLEEIEEKNNIQTQQEIQEYTSLLKEEPKAIPEEQTFDTIQNIIKEARGSSYTQNITLNSRISSLLYTVDSKEKFKQGISSAFNLSYEKVDELYKKNKLVWDWVNQFKE